MLQKYINSFVQKRNRAINDFEKNFYELLNNTFSVKKMEIIENVLKTKFFQQAIDQKIIRQQLKLNFNGTQKDYTNYDSYILKQKEVLMEKPIKSPWICHIRVE